MLNCVSELAHITGILKTQLFNGLTEDLTRLLELFGFCWRQGKIELSGNASMVDHRWEAQTDIMNILETIN